MEQLHDEQGHPRSPGSYSDLDNTADDTVSRRQQFHAAARLQLAAALLEYDYEQDGKLAEHSAIFAPYRQEPDLSGAAAAVPSSCTAPEHAQDGVPVQPDIDRREHGQAHELWQGEQQGQARYSVAYSNNDLISPSSAPRKSSDFLSPRSENGLAATNTITTGASPEQALSPPGPPTLYDEPEVDEAELASEWGLDNVVNKFENLDSNAFRAEASKIKAAAATTTSSSRKGVKGRKRSGTSGSDILLDLGGMTFDANLKLSCQENGEHEAEELEDPTFGIDAHSAPTVLLSKQQKKLRHRSGSMAKAVRKSLESELELAFSGSASNAEDFEGGAASQYGGRSRSSSFGAPFNGPFLTPEVAKDEAVKASADYAAEAVARPPSSLSMNGNYVSRFDPKAIAAQREEELSTRPRFPNALRPKILIMPAPLAELEAEEKARQEAEAQAELEAVTEKPRIEREAGKLYGRSLMDELQSRKERQKLRNRAFRGDSRKAMMDMQRFKRAPSPLATPGEEEGQGPPGVASPGEGEEGSDDDDKPLRPATSAPIGDDPWLKYTSHRSLANVAKGKSISGSNEITKGAVKNSPTSPALASPNKRKSLMPALDTQRHTLSTAELQHQYKQNRQSMLHLDKLANNEDDPSDDEDDDVPLGMRQEQLASSQNQNLSPEEDEDKPLLQRQQQTRFKEAQSVFGVDLVMQKELAKLEQILEIEEAEKRIQAERQRIKDAEREAKEAKKRAKAAKKEKKKKWKEKAKAKATGKDKKAPAVVTNRDDGVDVQWQTQRGSDPPVLDLPGDEHLQEWQEHDYQRQSYYSVQPKGEMDDFFGAVSNRNSK